MKTKITLLLTTELLLLIALFAAARPFSWDEGRFLSPAFSRAALGFGLAFSLDELGGAFALLLAGLLVFALLPCRVRPSAAPCLLAPAVLMLVAAAEAGPLFFALALFLALMSVFARPGRRLVFAALSFAAYSSLLLLFAGRELRWQVCLRPRDYDIGRLAELPSLASPLMAIFLILLCAGVTLPFLGQETPLRKPLRAGAKSSARSPGAWPCVFGAVVAGYFICRFWLLLGGERPYLGMLFLGATLCFCLAALRGAAAGSLAAALVFFSAAGLVYGGVDYGLPLLMVTPAVLLAGEAAAGRRGAYLYALAALPLTGLFWGALHISWGIWTRDGSLPSLLLVITYTALCVALWRRCLVSNAAAARDGEGPCLPGGRLRAAPYYLWLGFGSLLYPFLSAVLHAAGYVRESFSLGGFVMEGVLSPLFSPIAVCALLALPLGSWFAARRSGSRRRRRALRLRRLVALLKRRLRSTRRGREVVGMHYQRWREGVSGLAATVLTKAEALARYLSSDTIWLGLCLLAMGIYLFS